MLFTQMIQQYALFIFIDLITRVLGNAGICKLLYQTVNRCANITGEFFYGYFCHV